jgi:hypothetical protein
MPKPSDILNRTGIGGVSGPSAKPAFPIIPPAKDGDKDAKKKDGDSIAAKKPDLGHNISAKVGKAQGGGSGSAGRPKV